MIRGRYNWPEPVAYVSNVDAESASEAQKQSQLCGADRGMLEAEQALINAKDLKARSLVHLLPLVLTIPCFCARDVSAM